MATSAITIVELSANGQANQINIQWAVSDPHIGGLPYLQFDHAEVRYSSTVDMASPTTLNENAQVSYSHLQVLPGAEYYYQVRAVDRSGQFGEWSDPVLGAEQGIDSSAISTPWTDFTPTIGTGAGAVGAYTINSARYKQVATTCFFNVDFTVTDIGTAEVYLNVQDVPFEANISTSASAWFDDGSGRKTALSVAIFSQHDGTSDIGFMRYDGAYHAAAGRYVTTGSFEIGL